MDVDWEEELGENGPSVDAEDNVVRGDDEGEGDVEGEGEGDVPEDEEDNIGDDEDEEALEADVVEDPMVVEDEGVGSSKGIEEPAEYDDDD
jgi:DNA polymerase epsilon subunit 3